MQASSLQEMARPSVRTVPVLNFTIGQWAIWHTAEKDYIAKVEKLNDFDGHWQVRIYVPALGKSLWQYWNHLQPVQTSAQFASIGTRVRFMQRNGLVSIGEVIGRREKEVLVRSGNQSFAVPRCALLEVISRLR
jgi:hypothetical protein